MRWKRSAYPAILCYVLFAAPAWGQWISTTSPSGGSVNSFAILGDKLFAGTQEIGVLVSTDRGLNWVSASALLSQTHITALATCGVDLYAGTFYAQIYRSTDSGTTWALLNTGAYDEVRAFAAVGDTIFAATGLSGVLRSTNGGDTWTRASTGITSEYVNDFCMLGTVLYAAGDGIYRSTNGGNTWQPFDAGLTDSGAFSLATVGSNLFVATQTGIFVSKGGASWHRATSLLPPYQVSANTLLPIGGDLIVGSFYGIFVTSDDGETWNAKNEEMSDSTSICRLMTDNTNLFAGTYYGAEQGIWRRPLSEMIGPAAVSQPSTAKHELRTYPNPFSLSTNISVTLEKSGYADLTVVNLLGVEVTKIFSGELTAGEHTFIWNPVGLPDGMYECLIRTNGRIEKLPLMLAR
ncbi:MAG: hypothetical protein Q8922_09695 [Bacteroidota bacterium]|nr:hypothetical protein [Bacteroidota bacterium]MDP4234465.1 hypothetical protein [Bacteroidota bacterium]MDP4243953.1 hypothetical protein [Bacteroidota bacterium]MDP4288197.1 hypothetical protein [Bacteroidota bacterium]